MIHLIDLFEYIDHQRKAMKNKQVAQNETSQAAQTFKFIFQNPNETLDPANINFDYETLNQLGSDESMYCNGTWVNDLEEKLSSRIVSSHMLKGVNRIYDAALAPTGEYLAVSDDQGRQTFWNVEDNTKAHVLRPYKGLSKREDENQNVSFIGFVDGPDALMWQYLLTCNETQNDIRLWNTTDWDCIHAIKLDQIDSTLTKTTKSVFNLRIHGSIPDMRRKLHDQLFSPVGETFHQWGTFYQRVTFHHWGKF